MGGTSSKLCVAELHDGLHGYTAAFSLLLPLSSAQPCAQTCDKCNICDHHPNAPSAILLKFLLRAVFYQWWLSVLLDSFWLHLHNAISSLQ